MLMGIRFFVIKTRETRKCVIKKCITGKGKFSIKIWSTGKKGWKALF